MFVPGETGLATVEYYLDDPSMQPANMVQRVLAVQLRGHESERDSQAQRRSARAHTR